MKKWFLNCIFIVLTSILTEQALAQHGPTSELVVWSVTVSVQRCNDVFPELKSDLDSAFSAWKSRHLKNVALAENHPENQSALEWLRKETDKVSPATLTGCKALIREINAQ